MNTKNITYSAVFSAIFILLSVIAISTGIAYTLFLDVIVPIYICIVFFKLDRKQALFMSITSLTIVFFVLGNVIAAVWMAQGMIIVHYLLVRIAVFLMIYYCHQYLPLL